MNIYEALLSPSLPFRDSVRRANRKAPVHVLVFQHDVDIKAFFFFFFLML